MLFPYVFERKYNQKHLIIIILFSWFVGPKTNKGKLVKNICRECKKKKCLRSLLTNATHSVRFKPKRVLKRLIGNKNKTHLLRSSERNGSVLKTGVYGR